MKRNPFRSIAYTIDDMLTKTWGVISFALMVGLVPILIAALVYFGSSEIQYEKTQEVFHTTQDRVNEMTERLLALPPDATLMDTMIQSGKWHDEVYGLYYAVMDNDLTVLTQRALTEVVGFDPFEDKELAARIQAESSGSAVQSWTPNTPDNARDMHIYWRWGFSGGERYLTIAAISELAVKTPVADWLVAMGLVVIAYTTVVMAILFGYMLHVLRRAIGQQEEGE